jgi:MFS transporter, DHA2 family, multidrug resistance protein
MEKKPNRWAILGVVCLSVFLVVVDNTIVNVALPSLQRDLHASTSALQWIVDGYSLPFAGLLLAGAGVADRFGRKRVMQVGLVLFGLFSVGAAFSTATVVLITFRALMGASAAFVFPATQSILTVAFPDPSERAKAFGLWGAVSGLAVAFGPITGGLLITHFWYGSVFLVNVPLVLVALGLGLAIIPESRSDLARRFDLGGLILGTFGVTALVLALIEGPTWGWHAGTTLALFAAAITGIAAFTRYELGQREPILDVRMFRTGAFSGGAGGIGLAFFNLFGFIFLVTQYFQDVRGYSALSAGIHTLPFALTTMIAMPLAAVVALRVGVRYVIVAGVLLMAVGIGWMSLLGAHAAFFGPVIGSMVVMAIGFSLINPPSTAAIMGSLAPQQIGAGSAVNSVTRELGGTLGVAVLGSVFSSTFGPGIRHAFAPFAQHIPSAALTAASSSMTAAQVVAQKAVALGAPSSLLHQVNDAFMTSFHRACAVTAGVAILGALAVFVPLPSRPATKEALGYE